MAGVFKPQNATGFDPVDLFLIEECTSNSPCVCAFGIVVVDFRDQDRKPVGSRLLAERPRRPDRLAQGAERIGSGRKDVARGGTKEPAQPSREARGERRSDNAPNDVFTDPPRKPVAYRPRFCSSVVGI